jgi:nitrite reductase/ring-hydroxylating ferredoxin subunit
MSDVHTICAFAELGDPGARAFSIGEGPWPLRGLLVRVGNEVFAYLNRCPHAGHPLNLRPDDFLTADKQWLMCRSHGATFDRKTGECVAGPCVGRALRPLSTRVQDGLVLVDITDADA